MQPSLKKRELVGESPSSSLGVHSRLPQFVEWMAKQPTGVILTVPLPQQANVAWLTEPMGGYGGGIKAPFKAKELTPATPVAEKQETEATALLEHFLFCLKECKPLDKDFKDRVAGCAKTMNVPDLTSATNASKPTLLTRLLGGSRGVAES